MLSYKGYTGIVVFDPEAGLLHGEVAGLRDVVTFQGRSVDEVQAAFEASVDDYLAFCASRGEAPERAVSGRVTLRMPPNLHQRVAVRARHEGKSLNQWIADALDRAA